ncbi:MAG: hypothetical protein ACYC4L_11465 [Chloroflexota bacterium]
MPRKIFVQHPVSPAFTAGGQINLELSPKPYTITELRLLLKVTTTTSAAPGTAYDPWDRLISSLSLSGKGKPYFNFGDMRVARHVTRFFAPAMPPPPPLAASIAAGIRYYGYRLHFGLNPADPYDLSAGIPPSGAGNLSLTGVWGADTFGGTGYSTTSATLDVQCFGVQAKEGEGDAAIMPRAIPLWSHQVVTPSAVSSLFSSIYNVPSGDYLHDIGLVSYLGTGQPRSSAMLGSVQLYNQLQSQELFRADTYRSAEMAMQANYLKDGSQDWKGAILDAALAFDTPAISNSDAGLLWLPIAEMAAGGPMGYGADLRNVATGDLQVRYSVLSVTNVATLNVFLRKYQLL